jgi:hypothetical protein
MIWKSIQNEVPTEEDLYATDHALELFIGELREV